MTATDSYFAARVALYEQFGYVEDWHLYQVTDERRYFWRMTADGRGVRFAKTAKLLDDPGMSYYHEVGIDRLMRRGVWESADETMLLCDTYTDGNVILCIFDNAKRST